MKELNLVQEYAVCVMAGKKNLKRICSDFPHIGCTVGAIFCQMMMDGSLELDEKKRVIRTDKLPADALYLRELWERIGENKPKKLQSWIQELTYNFTVKKNRFLYDGIIASLREAGCVETVSQKGLFGLKRQEQIKKERADAVVQKIRAEFLEDGELTDETTVLSMLLKHSGELKRYFSKYEEKELKERLKQLKENEMASLVHTALEEIEGMVVAIIAASGSAGS